MNKRIAFIWLLLLAFAIAAHGQAAITVYDPTHTKPEENFSPSVQAAVEKAAIAASKSTSSDVCEKDAQIAGTASGAFTKARAKQTLAFYQYCQTGNGFGWAGLVLLEGDSVVGNYIAEAGWTNGIIRIADVNKNGLDEFALGYSGGMHQGQGGSGVDLMEFANGSPRGLGWYEAVEFGPDDDDGNAWKLTANPGSVPVFYTQKFASGANDKYKAIGKPVRAKLGKAISKFTAVK